jgi:hypothetical protein
MPNPENLEGQGFHTDPNRINKEGRPKGAKNLSTILKAMLEEDVEVVIDGKKERRQFQEVIIRKLLKKANDGDLRAIMEIFDRVEGKAKQEVKVEGQIIKIRFRDAE